MIILVKKLNSPHKPKLQQPHLLIVQNPFKKLRLPLP